jgi:internalin A
MSLADNFAEAQRRIAAARESGAEILDLGDLKLDRLPDELGRLPALRILALGHYRPIVNDGNLSWEWDSDRPPRDNNLVEISALAGLTHLQTLNLSGCNLTDASALAGLPRIHTLDLSSCKTLTDASALAALTQLQTLDLSHCIGLTDISAITALTQLHTLDLSWGKGPMDISALAALTQLHTLVLSWRKGPMDISALAALTQLHTLDLSWCDGLTDISALAALTQLHTLNCDGCEGLTKVTVLAGLSQLHTLSLSSCKNLIDVSALAGLTHLQTLKLSRCNGLTDLSALAGLTQLQTLDLSWCERLTGISAIAGLTQLQTLDLSWCERLTDISAIAGLTQLHSLDLKECLILTDISALVGLTQLQTLNLSHCKSLTDISAIAGLTQLHSLDLKECLSVTDISALAGLTQLQTLDLSWCVDLMEVSALANLTQLRTLNLDQCDRVLRFPPMVPLLDRLETIYLYGCRFEDLPAELCSDNYGDNVIDKVRAHYRDRALSEAQEAEVKVCILGNGGVGKTQLSRRLQELPFDPNVSTTHGVQFGHLDITYDEQSVRLNLWDFGGQDIYHGSHALFLAGQAVFILVWTQDRESRQFTDGGASMENRPLSYWLDYLRGLAGTDSPVLVVQSQCDQPDQRRSPNLPTHDFRLLRPLSCSAMTDLGLTVLNGELEDAVRDVLVRKPPVPIGLGRVEVRSQLRKMLQEDQQRPASKRKHRTLSLKQFRTVCKKNGKVSSPDALLDYLHHTGVVFFRQGMFEDRIILDRTWALEAIYTLFDRSRTFPILNRHGRFTRRELELLVWQDFSVEEQELFLSMMESCGICCRVRNLSNDRYNPEWEYLAPELLPLWSVAQDWLLGRMQGGREDATVEVRYRFLHEGILRGFLSRLGQQAGDAALYWRYGCWFFEKKTASQILVRSELGTTSGAGVITLRAVGERPQELLDTVLKELLRIPIGEPPEVSRSWESSSARTADALARVSDLKRQHATEIRSEPLDVAARPDLPAIGKPSIYISFAWGDDKSDGGRQRAATVTGLCAKLDSWGYEVLRDDRILRPGDWISTFMKAIGRGDHVLVILSDKYLHSPYCMTELFYIYSRSLGEKEDFLERVIPVVLADAGEIGGWKGRLKYAQHWEAEFQEMEPHLRLLGQADIDRYHLIKQWHTVIGNILGFIADTLHPHGFDAIVENDFAAVRQMLPPVGPR